MSAVVALYMLAVPFAAAFAAGALKLVWCRPRLVLFVVTGLVFLGLGLRDNLRARRILAAMDRPMKQERDEAPGDLEPTE